MDSPRSAVRVVDRRDPAAIGREARLELVFEQRRGRTVLAHAYAEPPFRIGRTFDLDGAAYLILVMSGPGVFAGDRLRQSISRLRRRAVCTGATRSWPAGSATARLGSLVR